MRRLIAAILATSLAGSVSCSGTITAPAKPLTVTGVIRDRDGAALTGARVNFRPAYIPGQPPVLSQVAVYVDANGSFQANLAPGKYDVYIDPGPTSGYAPVALNGTEFGPTQSRLDHTFTGTKVSGIVTGPSGTPLGNLFVGAVSVDYTVYNGIQTSNAGSYAMFLPPGAYSIYTGSGEYGIPSLTLPVQVTSADTSVNFALAGNEVRVTVSVEGGPSVAGAYVIAQSNPEGVQAANITGLDGTTVLYLPDGDYLFSARSPDQTIVYPVEGHWLVSGNTTVAINFPGTRWDMTLRRSSDNSIVPFVGVTAYEVGSYHYGFAKTDASGQFHFFVRPNAGYTLSVTIGNSYPPYPGPYVSTTADSTFDVVVDVP